MELALDLASLVPLQNMCQHRVTGSTPFGESRPIVRMWAL